MKRKVSKIGPATLMVSLPAAWCREFNIKQGHELDIIQQDDTLIISKEEITRDLGNYEIKIMVEKEQDLEILLLAPYLLAPYTQGYSSITIHFKNPNIIHLIYPAVAKFLLGFEIIEQGENYCVIKSVAKGIEENFSVIFNRIFHQTIAMSENIMEAILRKEYETLYRIKQEEQFIDKLNYFCKRMLQVQKPVPIRKISHIYRIIGIIEEIGDCYKYISNNLLQYQHKPSEKLIEYFKEVNRFVRLTYKWIKKFDEDEYFQERPKFTFFYSQDIYPTIPQNDAALLGYLIMIVHRLIHITDEELTKDPLF